MTNKKSSSKKIAHILTLSLIISALVISIIFSTFNISSKTTFNSRYSGGYEALVEVFDQKSNSTSGNEEAANGDATKAANSLQKKLSPFSDNTVEIKVVGEHRVTIKSTKEQYNNNTELFKNAIEQDGGLIAFNSEYKDILFDDTTMTKVTGSAVYDSNNKTQIAKKTAISEIFGEVTYKSERDTGNTSGQQNSPFLYFDEGTNGSYLNKLSAATTEEGSSTSTPQQLTLVSSFESVLNNVRQYYLLYPNKDSENDYLNAYYNYVLSPLITAYSTADENTKAVLDDFFTISYQVKDASGIVSTQTASLLGDKINWWWRDTNKIGRIEAEDPVKRLDELKGLFYGSYKGQKIDDYQFSFVNNVSKYVIDPNSTTKDFSEAKEGEPAGKYYDNFKFTNNTSQGIKIDEVASILNKQILKNVVFANKTSASKSDFNPNLDKKHFENYFIMIDDKITSQQSAATRAMIHGANPTFTIDSQLRIKAQSATIAKTIESSISQTTSGFTFRVVRMSEFPPEISIYMLIASIVFLIILAIFTMVFLLIAYRLLGLYTLIIATTAVVITILAPTLFSIAIGVEMYTMIFIVLGLVLDSCVLIIESFKKHLNKEKRSVSDSIKLANKENISIIMDSILLVIIPNIVLFWIGQGTLRNFATVATLSTVSVLVLVLVIFRFMIWLTIKSEIFRKHPLWLPVDTKEVKSGVAIFNKMKLSKLEYLLNILTTKDKVNSKDLLKIKKVNDQINALNLVIEEKEKTYQEKQISRNKAKLAKIEQQIVKANAKKSKRKNWFKEEWIKYLTFKKDYSKSITKKESQDKIAIAKENKDKNLFLNLNRMIISIVLVFAAIGGIFAVTIGPNYSNSFGKDNTYLIYGDYLNNFSGQNQDNFVNKLRDEVSEKAADQYVDESNKIANKYFDKGNVDPSDGMYVAELSAYTFEYVLTNNYSKVFYSGAPKISGTIVLNYGIDYNVEGATTSATSNSMPWVQIDISRNTNFNKTKRLIFGILTGTARVPSDSITNSHGVLGMYQYPFTAFGQINQILITFAILLLFLLAYIVIRFKWTYYVALALALIIVFAITTSLIIVFRVPVNIEILITMVSVISFTIMSLIIILGKVRTLVSAKSKKELFVEFNTEVNLYEKMKLDVLELKKSKKELKAKAKINKNKLLIKKVELSDHKVSKFLFINKIKAILIINKTDKLKANKAEIKSLKKLLRSDLKPINSQIRQTNKKARKEINKVIKQNSFMKDIYKETIKFGMNRLIYLVSFYVLFAIILVVTIPSIVGVGLTLLIGIIIANIVILSMSLPLLINLEKRRITSSFGNKEFIKKTTISQEEQIVVDIND